MSFIATLLTNVNSLVGRRQNSEACTKREKQWYTETKRIQETHLQLAGLPEILGGCCCSTASVVNE